MRAPFNTTCDVAYGARSVTGPPGVQYAAAVPCRVVRQQEITQIQFPFSLSNAWVTIKDVDPSGPRVSSPFNGATLSDYKACDVLTIPSGGTERYAVVREELVDPFRDPLYFRYLLVPLASLDTPPWLPQTPFRGPPSAISCVDATLAGGLGLDALVVDEVPPSVSVVWWFVGVLSAGDYHIRLPLGLIPSAVNMGITPWYGTACGSAIQGPYLYPSSADCVDFSLAVGTNVWVRVENTGPSGVGTPYQWVMEAGLC